ncbi:L-lactate permease [Pseudomonas sp. 3A(2025)]
MTIVPYILGGLIFWQIAMSKPAGMAVQSPALEAGTTVLRRRTAFFACFLIGPFAESATGFGVGMLGTVALLRGMRLAPVHLMIFALLSQTFIPWGAMGSGTILAAAYARMSPSDLGVYSVIPVSLLMIIWLPLFWRTAANAGMAASRTECLREALWMIGTLVLLAMATDCLGPETGLLAAFGPLILLRFLSDRKPDSQQALNALVAAMPYIVLVAGLVASRLLPDFRTLLTSLGKVAPYDDLPKWSPLFHAGSWLIGGALMTAAIKGTLLQLPKELQTAWKTGKQAVLTVFLFAMLAEVLTAAGISHAFAQGMFDTLQTSAVLLTPITSAAFGILANSGNAPNSLFMPSQYALAVQAGLSIPALAALQHTSGTCMGLFSPVRMSIAAGLCVGHNHERAVYRLLLPCAVGCLTLFILLALLVSHS